MRVLLADNERTVRQALRLLLEQATTLEIAGEVEDTAGLFAALSVSLPDLILLDWELPGQEDGALLPRLRASVPSLVIAMSSWPEAEPAARTAGVDGFIGKDMPAEKVLAIVDDVLQSHPAA